MTNYFIKYQYVQKCIFLYYIISLYYIILHISTCIQYSCIQYTLYYIITLYTIKCIQYSCIQYSLYNIYYYVYNILYILQCIQYIKLSTIHFYLSTINLWITLLISISISVFPTLLKVIHNFFLPYMAIIILYLLKI